MNMKNALACPRFASTAVILASAGALAVALVAEYGAGLKPCTLCLYQRAPFAVTILLGGLGLFMAMKNKTKTTAFLVFISGITYLAGALIAFYHNGVEQHWWTSFLEGCKISFDSANGDLLKQIETAPPARCDQIPWQDPVLGLSMAAWNIFFSAGLAILSLVSAILMARKANGFL